MHGAESISYVAFLIVNLQKVCANTIKKCINMNFVYTVVYAFSCLASLYLTRNNYITERE